MIFKLIAIAQNSSNSLRLTEIALAAGTDSYLVDDVSKINPNWLEGVDNILLTAGASAPERLVLEIINHLELNFDGTLAEESVVDEGMFFAMPSSLKNYLKNKEVTIEGKDQ